MSEQDNEELTRGEGFAAFERRMMNLFDRMAARIDAEADESRRRDEELHRRDEESRRRDEALERRVESNERRAEQWEERIQRAVEFLMQQQAQSQVKSEADMQRLRELHEQNEKKWERISEETRALLAIAEIQNAEINELRRTQAESQARTDAKFAETGERVDALVNTVERLISERRDGGGKREESPG